MKSFASGGAREEWAGSPQPAAWSESFQDLGSWCLPHRDELNTPVLSNQNEFSFSFDDQSKYSKWDVSPPPLELPMDMWGDSENVLSPTLAAEEENNEYIRPVETAMTSTGEDSKMFVALPYGKVKEEAESPIRYKGNLVLTQCSLEGQQLEGNEWPDKLYDIKEEPEPEDMFRIPITKSADKRERPNLKLNIMKANQPAPPLTSDINPVLLSTPDALQSLTTGQDFNIIKYVEGIDESASPFVFEEGSSEQESVASTSQQADPKDIKYDHDYTSPESLPVKEEPLSPKVSKTKRSRRPPAADEYDFYAGGQSDSSDWSPSDERPRKRARTKRSRKSSESDAASVASGGDRYRELRDRNNEASRRSRMNRKKKETEMMQLSLSLERNNARLKSTAAVLEKRVKSLRKILMKVVLEKSSKI